MDFQRLEIQNFLAIGGPVRINLANQGLVLVQGENQDDSSANSNGTGKSSIADALSWVCYGETARGVSGDDVVNDTAKKNCLVTVVIQDGATRYTITRARKDKDLKNQTRVLVAKNIEGIEQIDISKGTEKETQALIETILGCSHDVFVAAIYAGQEATPDLPKMTDKALKLLIEEAAGTENLEKAYTISRNKLMEVKNKLDSETTLLNNCIDVMQVDNEKLVKATVAFNEYESLRKQLAADYGNDAKLYARDMQLIKVKIAESNEAELRKSLAELESSALSLRKEQETLDNLKSIFFAKDKQAAEAQIKLRTLAEKCKEVKNKVEKPHEYLTEPCKECGKPHDASDIEAFKKHAKTQLLTAISEVNAANDAFKILSVELIKTFNDYKTYESAMTDGTEVFAKAENLRTEIKEIEKLHANEKTLRADVERMVAKAKDALSNPNPQKSLIDSLNESIAKGQAKATALKSAQHQIENDMEVANSVMKVFSPAGVRAHILDAVTPFLNERTADYLSALSDGNISAVWTTLTTTSAGELREKFNIEVSNERGGKSFKSLSGGEKRKVRLSTMLALQDLVASRASKPINIWLGDEIDEALDDAGLERLMGILERKARERGTVLIISHNALTDWCDTTMKIVKKGGLSTIEGDLSV